MREIKFRAWNLETKRMQSGECLDWVNGIFIAGVWDFNEENVVERQNAIVMQYTGLTDKNGVEIYEGDVVDDDLIGLCVVKYNEKHAAFKLVHKNKIRAKWFVDYLPNEFSYLNVIGNIYEHSHLIDNN